MIFDDTCRDAMLDLFSVAALRTGSVFPLPRRVQLVHHATFDILMSFDAICISSRA